MSRVVQRVCQTPAIAIFIASSLLLYLFFYHNFTVDTRHFQHPPETPLQHTQDTPLDTPTEIRVERGASEGVDEGRENVGMKAGAPISGQVGSTATSTGSPSENVEGALDSTGSPSENVEGALDSTGSLSKNAEGAPDSTGSLSKNAEGAPDSTGSLSENADGAPDSKGSPSENSKGALDSTGSPSENADGVLDEEWYAAVERRFKERLQRLQEVCKKYNNPTYSLRRTYDSRLYFSGRYSLMVCLVPKIASSTWMSHLLHMRDVIHDTKNLHTNDWKNKIRAKKVLGKSGTKNHLQTATNVLTARHPLERLVSAFRDKFANGQRLQKAQSSIHYRYFWKPALKALKKPKDVLQLSFVEFLRFVLTNQQEGHWATVHRLCSPCTLSYHLIMRLETFTEDILYLKQKLDISEVDLHEQRNKKASSEETVSGDGLPRQLVKEKGSTLKNSTLQYYLQVPSSLLAQVLRLYKIDLEMFGYQVPPLLSKVLDV